MPVPDVYQPSNLASRKKTRETKKFVPFVPPAPEPNSTLAERKAARRKTPETKGAKR